LSIFSPHFWQNWPSSIPAVLGEDEEDFTRRPPRLQAQSAPQNKYAVKERARLLPATGLPQVGHILLTVFASSLLFNANFHGLGYDKPLVKVQASQLLHSTGGTGEFEAKTRGRSTPGQDAQVKDMRKGCHSGLKVPE
jgi:hypothetical protein